MSKKLIGLERFLDRELRLGHSEIFRIVDYVKKHLSKWARAENKFPPRSPR